MPLKAYTIYSDVEILYIEKTLSFLFQISVITACPDGAKH